MKRTHLLALLLLFIAVGFASHAITNPASATSFNEKSSNSNAKSKRAILTTNRTKNIQQLTKGAQEEGGREEWFRWLAYLENTSVEELPRYVERVGNNPIALSLIAQRWVELNPESCLRYLLTLRGEVDFVQYDSPGQLFSKLFFTKWARLDPQAAIAALDQSEPVAALDRLRESLVSTLWESDIEQALALAGRWKTSDINDSIPPQLREWATQNPHAAAVTAFQTPSSPYLNSLAQIWGKAAPQEALTFAFQQSGNRRLQLAEIVFAQWSRDDFAAASKHLSGLPEKEATFLTPTLIQSWSQTDPTAALNWSQESLSGRTRTDAIERVIIASVDSDKASPPNLLALIESPEDYHQAVVALSNKLWGRGYSPEDPKLPEQLSWLSDISDSRTMEHIFFELVNPWADSDFEGFRDFIATPRAQSVSPNNFQVAAALFAHKAPEEAMEFVQEIPDRLLPSATSSAFSAWYQKDPEEATAWAARLDQEDPRRPFLVKELRFRYFDPHEQVIAHLNTFPPIIKTLLRERIAAKERRGIRAMRQDGSQVDFSKLLEDSAEPGVNPQ